MSLDIWSFLSGVLVGLAIQGIWIAFLASRKR